MHSGHRDRVKQNFEACVTTKKLVTVEGAGHGLAYPKNPERYVEELRNFFDTV